METQALRYLALATDYDGTLAHHGTVSPATIAALERWIASGRKLLLVTGRELEEMGHVFPRLELFTSIVAENGGVLFKPGSATLQCLAVAPQASFVDQLRAAGVKSLSVGHVIVATQVPYDTEINTLIRQQGLDLHVILNKGSVMVLPRGVDKGTGFMAALADLGLSAEQVVGVGDGENDADFLRLCGLSVAVANALPELKAQVDRVTTAPQGEGVTELIEDLLGR